MRPATSRDGPGVRPPHRGDGGGGDAGAGGDEQGVTAEGGGGEPGGVTDLEEGASLTGGSVQTVEGTILLLGPHDTHL